MARRLLIGLVATLAASQAIGQSSFKATPVCVYSASAVGGALFIFRPSGDALSMVNDIVRPSGLPSNFVTEAANVPVAAAAIADGRHYLLYNQLLFASATEIGNENWVAMAMLAHQIGHLLLGHRGLTVANELEADRFAGSALRRLGASASQADSVLISADYNPVGAATPERPSRLKALREGWASVRETELPWASPSDGIPMLWPPPRPSARVNIPTEWLRKAGHTHLGDVAATLERAFDSAGYTERSFFAVPDGFALVSRLEQMNADGRPIAGDDRWAIAVTPPKVFSLASYMHALLGSNPGRYRVVVFVVTPHSFSPADQVVGFKVSRDWLWTGGTKLPPSIGVLEFSGEYYCTALIYEFDQSSIDEAAALALPSSLSGKSHLERAGIWQALAR